MWGVDHSNRQNSYSKILSVSTVPGKTSHVFSSSTLYRVTMFTSRIHRHLLPVNLTWSLQTSTNDNIMQQTSRRAWKSEPLLLTLVLFVFTRVALNLVRSGATPPGLSRQSPETDTRNSAEIYIGYLSQRRESQCGWTDCLCVMCTTPPTQHTPGEKLIGMFRATHLAARKYVEAVLCKS